MVEGTEDLIFYHGTVVAAANAILKHGARNSYFEEIGARELGRKIRRALLESADLPSDEDYRLHSAFAGPGSESSDLWVLAFRQLEYPEDASLIEYGHFFATLNIANAYRYAMTPYRSEFIRALGESLKVLSHRGHWLPRSVAMDYPEVAHLLENPSPPVVLELRGIGRERVLNEIGSRDIDSELELFRMMQEYEGFNAPTSFRIRDVTPADVVAVHDLSEWFSEAVHDSLWHPEPAKVSGVRHSVDEWLAREATA